MAIKKAIMKIFNGSGWDEYHPKTSSDQVKHFLQDGSEKDVNTLLNEFLSGGFNFLKIQTAKIPTVKDCLLETTESGYYSWYMAKNQPGNHVNGLIRTIKYNTDHSFRIAFTYNGLMYFSHYNRGAGQWGFWKEISFK